MLTLQPSIIPGAYKYDPELLPEDEFRVRIDRLKALMDAHGLAAVFDYGDCREHAVLAYYSNFIPRNRWALALLPREGEPRVLASVATRSIPAHKPMTWIADLQSGQDLPRTLDPWLDSLKTDARRAVGTLGADLMAPSLYDAMERTAAAKGLSLKPIDALVAEWLEEKRPRELALQRRAVEVAHIAATQWIQAWRQSLSVMGAAFKAERAARSRAVHDVRFLVSADGGETLEPFHSGMLADDSLLLGYVAVKSMGFWADTFVTARRAHSAAYDAAQRGMEAMLRKVRAGTTGAELHAALTATLGNFRPHPVLQGSVGQPIGLSLHAQVQFTDGCATPLRDTGVYSLYSGASAPGDHAVVSAMVLITSDGFELLMRSDEAGKQ